MTDCKECATSRPFRNLSLDGSYWRPLIGGAPEEALLAMSEATLCAIHHRDSSQSDEPALLAGVRALIGYYESRDVVPREEAEARIRNAFNDYMRERTKLEQTATENALKAYGDRLREAQMRLANVQALLWKTRRGRKTMLADDVRVAIEWNLGEPIPEVTREQYAHLYDLQAGQAPQDPAAASAHSQRDSASDQTLQGVPHA